MNSFSIKLIFPFGFFLLASCDTVPMVRSSVAWNGTVVDQACVRKAIEATPGVSFEREDNHESTGFCIAGDCDLKTFISYYVVNSNTEFKQAVVRFIQTSKGHLRVEHVAAGRINGNFTPEDRTGFEKAQTDLSRAITKNCPESISETPKM
jgi:hypothetical protein